MEKNEYSLNSNTQQTYIKLLRLNRLNEGKVAEDLRLQIIDQINQKLTFPHGPYLSAWFIFSWFRRDLSSSISLVEWFFVNSRPWPFDSRFYEIISILWKFEGLNLLCGLIKLWTKIYVSEFWKQQLSILGQRRALL